MSRTQFFKYQGTGNDFILVEDFDESFLSSDQESVSLVCDHHFGIGGDGLILCQKSDKADFKIRFFNGEGVEIHACGSSLRCLTTFLYDAGMVKESCMIESSAGTHLARIVDGRKIAITMLSPIAYDLCANLYRGTDGYHVHEGGEHLVVFAQELNKLNIQGEGEKLHNNPQFAPQGVSVNFVAYTSGPTFAMRTFEKGIERETLTSGTGAVAAAYVLKKILKHPIQAVRLASHELLEFVFHPSDPYVDVIWRLGGVSRVFEGYMHK